jgi:hypothetical protein
MIGRQGIGFLNTHYATIPEGEWRFERVSEFIYQFCSEPVFAVAARKEPTDGRDLRRIAPSIRELLAVASDMGRQTVLTGLIAAGPHRKWHPIFSLIEMLRGARMAAEDLGERCPSLAVNILDPAVWFPLQARKINVEDILSSPNVEFWAEVQPYQGEGSRLLCVRSEEEKLAVVAGLFGFTPAPVGWEVEVHPRPTPDVAPQPLAELWEHDLGSIGVVHGSTVLFREKARVMT